MRVIFTCGGTGGHINPAIAVANLLKERYPDCEILFIGAAGEMEEKLVPQAGFPLRGLPASSFRRGKSLKAFTHNIHGVGQIVSAMRSCKKILRQFKPDVIVGTGGYASFPALYMGARLGIPICVHEANAVPGLATRLVADRADRILVSFRESAAHYKHPERVEVVGMPVRREFIYTKREDARRELGLDERPLILSAFGSLGAREMNKAVAEMFRLEQKQGLPYQHIHATGSYGWKWMPDHVKSLGVDLEHCAGLSMQEYIYNMPTLMAAADVVISRAGSSSLNEIGASGTPCIIIPSPNVTDNHQEKNARVLSDRGGAVLLLEKDCTGARLMEETEAILESPARQKQMRSALLSAVVLDSAEKICDIIKELAQKGCA